jgi:Arc/MetJ-type ribon-helix-helix transcriptional regulator
MRSIINISVPADLKKDVELALKQGEYATKSEFFRELLRAWKSQQETLKALRESQKSIRAGKGKVLRSLKDLR